MRLVLVLEFPALFCGFGEYADDEATGFSAILVLAVITATIVMVPDFMNRFRARHIANALAGQGLRQVGVKPKFSGFVTRTSPWIRRHVAHVESHELTVEDANGLRKEVLVVFSGLWFGLVHPTVEIRDAEADDDAVEDRGTTHAGPNARFLPVR